MGHDVVSAQPCLVLDKHNPQLKVNAAFPKPFLELAQSETCMKVRIPEVFGHRAQHRLGLCSGVWIELAGSSDKSRPKNNRNHEGSLPLKVTSLPALSSASNSSRALASA